jgi:hypothetical protein
MSELRSVLDALATDDLHEFSDGAVLDPVACCWRSRTGSRRS